MPPVSCGFQPSRRRRSASLTGTHRASDATSRANEAAALSSPQVVLFPRLDRYSDRLRLVISKSQTDNPQVLTIYQATETDPEVSCGAIPGVTS